MLAAFVLDSLVIVYGLVFSLLEMQLRVVPKLTEILGLKIYQL